MGPLIRPLLLTFCSLLLSVPSTTYALVSNQPVSSLLQKHAEHIAELKSITTEEVGSIASEPYSNDVFYLRYCLEYGDDKEAAKEILLKNLAWRQGETGKKIASAALEAVTKATGGGSWNNEPVLGAAPFTEKVSKYLSDHCITTTTSQGDLLYCIRAGQIDDVGLMGSLTVDQMKDFFLYVKEVNALVSQQRSLDSDKLVSIVTANDLKGVKLVGGSADFRKALSASSKESDTLYPATNGPTLLLNLPRILSALVKLFTPLFPESVKARLRFEQGPLSDITSLSEVAKSGAKRDIFLSQIDKLIY